MTDAAAFTGDIPRFYDKHLGPIIFADYAADLARRAAALSPKDVLELAAGTGISTAALRAALPASTRIIATDLNDAMLEVARAKAPAGVEFRQANAMELPFADASFDLVVIQFGVMFFPDRPAAYREARRVLRPGGRCSSMRGARCRPIRSRRSPTPTQSNFCRTIRRNFT